MVIYRIRKKRRKRLGAKNNIITGDRTRKIAHTGVIEGKREKAHK